MEGKRYKFAVNTSTTCFLCFEDIKSNSEIGFDGGRVEVESNYSLRTILRHLQIDLSDIHSISLKSRSLLNRTDVRVSLCSECEVEMEKFTELYKVFEEIQMKMDYLLERMKRKLEGEGSNKLERLEAYRRKIADEEGFNVQAQKHSKIVEELRKEIERKCGEGRRRYHPQIQLKRLTLNQELQKIVRSRTAPDPTNTDSEPVAIFIKQEMCDTASAITNTNEFLSYPLEGISSSELHNEESNCGLSSSSKEPQPPPSPAINKTDSSEMLNNATTTDEITLEDTKPILHIVPPLLPTKPKLKTRSNLKKKVKVPSSSMMFKKNLQSHTFNCTSCKKPYKSQEGTIHHYRSVHLRERYKCDICGDDTFSRMSSLTLHKQTCSGNDNRSKKNTKCVFNSETEKFQCTAENCNGEFSSRGDAQNHYNAAHLHKTEFKCEICNISKFQYIGNLQMHQKTCREKLQTRLEKMKARENDPRYEIPCVICKKTFSSVQNMNQHKKLVHLNERRYKCHLCKNSYQKTSKLQDHLDVIHNGKTFDCKYCPKKYRSRYKHKYHEVECLAKIKIKVGTD